MNKTISINIGGRNFFIEEHAFAKLDQYLQGIKAHFSTLQGSEEIIADMESRIAEKFSDQFKNNSQGVITEQDVNQLITELGTIEELSGNDNSQKQAPAPEYGKRKFFRDTDNALIGGVCSGIAAYFDIDVTVIRLIFIVLTLAGGAMVPIYLVLWIVVPEAKSATEKMQMRGQPLNVATIKETIKEKAAEAKSHSGKLQQVIKAIFGTIGVVIRFIFQAIGKIAGLLMTIFSIVAFAFLTFFAAVAVFNANSPLLDFPLSILSRDTAYFGLIILAYFTILIPLLFATMLGISIFRKKNIIPASIGFTMLGVWLLVAISGGVLATRKVPQFVEQVKASPQMQDVTKTYDQKDFSSVNLSGWDNYKLVQGPQYGITIKGRAMDIESFAVTTNNGVLTINHSNRPARICLFCISNPATIEITAPSFNVINGTDSARIIAETLNASSTAITLDNSSRATVHVTAQTLTLNIKDSSRAIVSGTTGTLNAKLVNSSRVEAAEMTATTTMIDATNSSRITLGGTGNTLTAKLQNSSRLEAPEFTTATSTISAEDSSRAQVNVSGSLTINKDNSSRVYYSGQPKVQSNEKNSPSDPLPPEYDPEY